MNCKVKQWRDSSRTGETKLALFIVNIHENVHKLGVDSNFEKRISSWVRWAWNPFEE